MSSIPSKTHRKRPRTTMVALVVAQQFLCCSGFTGVQPTSSASTAATFSRPTMTTIFFRDDNEEGHSIESSSFILPSSTQHLSTTASDLSDLPPWLSTPKSHLAFENMQTLERAMFESRFFTGSETRRLLQTIEELSEGSLQRRAGAAEFCRILVDQMEMGFSAIMAAAFHYYACVNARKSENHQVDHTVLVEELLRKHSVEESIRSIARDASRLKQLEVLAARVDMGARPDSIHAETVRKLLLSETKDWRALAIRSAACLYRMRGCESDSLTPESISCGRDALHVYAPLASRLGMHRLKNELEGAAFKLLYKRQYKAVSAQTDIAASMQTVLKQVQVDMKDMLLQDKEFSDLVQDFKVTARVKEPYSLWKKMLRYGYKSILQVPDAIALRLVLNGKRLGLNEPSAVLQARERALCYYAQKVCMTRWNPMASQPRFKDYIERPKQNGYQSLHYTAESHVADKTWMLEIQVRSGEMHRVAEFGLASHWDYKAKQAGKVSLHKLESVGSGNSDLSSNAYLCKLQEWHWQQHGGASHSEASVSSTEPASSLNDVWQNSIRERRIKDRSQQLEPYIQALTEAQSNLARDYVFVFLTPSDKRDASGRVLTLPAGACVLDALREGEKAIGCSLTGSNSGFALNGAATSITRQLSNGDVLTLPHCGNAVAA
ncbi:hypothetical protein MPSEU_000648800 [Mayamaea pseudoterrestris]|nr:hypothetical protein MPSEU_000648800 [Mayamaea pseudoterrestris]